MSNLKRSCKRIIRFSRIKIGVALLIFIALFNILIVNLFKEKLPQNVIKISHQTTSSPFCFKNKTLNESLFKKFVYEKQQLILNVKVSSHNEDLFLNQTSKHVKHRNDFGVWAFKHSILEIPLNSCERVRHRIEPAFQIHKQYRCLRVKQLVRQGLLEYVLREGDEELCALVQPIFTRRKLVVWTSDHHSAPVLDFRSLVEPLGVEFIDHSQYFFCDYFCHCDGIWDFRGLTESNILEMNPEQISKFQKEYSTTDSEIARVDAFAMFYCSSQYELFKPYNKSIISVTALRYEACRTPRRWIELNDNLFEIFGKKKHVIGANNLYDREYIRYFTGLQVDLLPSFCVYTGSVYNPVHNSFIFYPQRKGFEGSFAEIWSNEFNYYYKNKNSTFELFAIRSKFQKYESSDLASHLGIVHIPYQTSTMSIFEQYRIGIPLFFAAYKTFVRWNFKYRLAYDRTKVGLAGFPNGSDIPPHFSQRGIPDPNDEGDPESHVYWLRFSDFYTLPHITYFDSIEDLVSILQEMTRERLVHISSQMRAFNRQVLKKLLIYWRRRLLDIAQYSQNHPN